MAHLYYKYSSMAEDVMVMWIDLYDYSKSNPSGRRSLETEVVTRNQSHPTHLLVVCHSGSKLLSMGTKQITSLLRVTQI